MHSRCVFCCFGHFISFRYVLLFFVLFFWTTTPAAISSESWGTIVRRLRSTHFGILVSIHFSVPVRVSECPIVRMSDFCGFVWSRRAPHLRSVASQLTVRLTEPPGAGPGLGSGPRVGDTESLGVGSRTFMVVWSGHLGPYKLSLPSFKKVRPDWLFWSQND